MSENPLAKTSHPVTGASEPDAPPDWQKAFQALVLLTCTGFVTSAQVNNWVQQIHDHVDPRCAKYMTAVFNKTRSGFMQGFMG